MKTADGHIVVKLEAVEGGCVITHDADCPACQAELPIGEFAGEFLGPYEDGYLLPKGRC